MTETPDAAELVPAELIDLAMTGANPGCRADAAFYLANVLPTYDATVSAERDQLADVLVVLMGVHQNREPHRNLDRRGCQGCQMFHGIRELPSMVAAEKRFHEAVATAVREGNFAWCPAPEARIPEGEQP